LRRYFTLERGLVCGIGLIIFSAGSFLYLFLSYLRLLPSLSILLRFDLAVYAIMSFTLGVQLIYTSFLLSLFYLKIK